MNKFILIFLILLPSIAFADIRGVVVKGGVAVNIIVLPDGWTGIDGEWKPLESSIVIIGKNGNIGDAFDGNVFIEPVKEAKDIAAETLRKEIAAESRMIIEKQRTMAIGQLKSEGVVFKHN